MVDLAPGGQLINCLYFTLVLLGMLYTLISLIGADFGGGVDVAGPDIDFSVGEFDVGGVQVPGVELGVDAPDVDVGGGLHLPSFSAFTIASFMTGFGACGLVATLAFDVSPAVSLIWAMVGGAILGGAVQVFFGAVLLKSQGSSEVRIAQLAGKRAEVTVPITSGDHGRIAVVVRGRRATFAARADEEVDIPRGAHVEIVRMGASTAVVRPIEGK